MTDTAAAAEPDAPRLFDEAKSNVCLDAQLGDKAKTEAAFARAAHVAKFETWVQRITGAPMEPRAALSEYNPETKRYTLYAGSGGAVRLKNDLATVLGVPRTRVRVIMHDVGGNFGTRGMIYPGILPRGLGRTARRPPGQMAVRAQRSLPLRLSGARSGGEAELALDAEGNFLAMRGSNIGNAGAHTTNFSPLQKGVEIMSSIYRMPAAHFRARAVLSNTSPTRPYRSAGRPEVMYVMERLIDLACRDFGFDRVEFAGAICSRRTELPYKNPFGMTYDSGRLPAGDGLGARAGDWDGFPERRAEARQRGKYRGIAVANYVDTATGQPRERTEITIHRDGWIDVVIGTVSNGQGHETSFAQLINEWFGRPARQGADHHRRHRHREGRRRHPFRTRHAARELHHEDRIRRDHRQRQAACRPSAGSRAGRHRLRRRQVLGQGNRPRHRPVRARGRVQSNATICPTICAVRLAADCDKIVKEAELPLWRPCLRGRGRPGDGQRRNRALHHGRRRRPRR